MAEETTAAVIEAGEYCLYLQEKKIKAKPLGNNASGVEMIELDVNDLVQVAKELKRAKKMEILNFLTALEVKKGYQSIYQIENRAEGKAVVLKVTVARDNATIPSLTELYPTADWQEREAYDMIGINYEGHPNLTRILNPDDWQGHPLRKDYIGPVDALNQPLKFKNS